ncbi:hypothetical protein QL285_040149 [Trifolium repens]|nr:hypothetical protein QL285_040149 [Trifolium repens]
MKRPPTRTDSSANSPLQKHSRHKWLFQAKKPILQNHKTRKPETVTTTSPSATRYGIAPANQISEGSRAPTAKQKRPSRHVSLTTARTAAAPEAQHCLLGSTMPQLIYELIIKIFYDFDERIVSSGL